MKSVRRIGNGRPALRERARVAAYCRVSKESERLDHSLSNQVSYFSALIQSNPEWEYAGVYTDLGLSGLRTERRDGFARLIADCELGLIDIVLVKSISRFARNTVDLLKTVRRLRELGIDVRFEKEGVRTLSAEGEVVLTLLASFAQQESESISENVKWGIRKRMQMGIAHGRPRVFGYAWEGGRLSVDETQAPTVRRIFSEFAGGASVRSIVRGLNAEGIASREGGLWSRTSVAYLLENRAYAGDLHLQKSFVADPVSGRRRRNRGELPQYIVEGDHEPIVGRATFDAAQRRLAGRRELGWRGNEVLNLSCFSGMVKCAVCGKSYVRGCTRESAAADAMSLEKVGYWACTSAKAGKCDHATCYIRDDVLRDATARALGLDAFDEDAFTERVECVTAHPDRRLVFELADGEVREVEWESTARRDSWTEERRAAKRAEYRRNSAKGEGRFYPFTTRLRCAGCGADFRHRVNVTKSRGRVGRWTHSGEVREGCALFGLDDERLERICAEAMGLDSFDGVAFMERVDAVEVTEEMSLAFRFADGTTRTLEYGRHGRGRALPAKIEGGGAR